MRLKLIHHSKRGPRRCCGYGMPEEYLSKPFKVWLRLLNRLLYSYNMTLNLPKTLSNVCIKLQQIHTLFQHGRSITYICELCTQKDICDSNSQYIHLPKTKTCHCLEMFIGNARVFSYCSWFNRNRSDRPEKTNKLYNLPKDSTGAHLHQERNAKRKNKCTPGSMLWSDYNSPITGIRLINNYTDTSVVA